MHTVTSADGTRIAYDRYGEGPAVILVNGALGYRKFKNFEQIATALSEHYTVINYDRRGRGASGEAGATSVQHEVDDIAALIAEVGGRASLCGFSSGGALALRAAAAGVGVEKLVLYEVPFKTDPNAKYPADDYGARLEPVVASGEPHGGGEGVHAQRRRASRPDGRADDADADVQAVRVQRPYADVRLRGAR